MDDGYEVLLEVLRFHLMKVASNSFLQIIRKAFKFVDQDIEIKFMIDLPLYLISIVVFDIGL